MMSSKLRIALAAALVTLAAVSAVDSASAGGIVAIDSGWYVAVDVVEIQRVQASATWTASK